MEDATIGLKGPRPEERIISRGSKKSVAQKIPRGGIHAVRSTSAGSALPSAT
jgi:hypothetical protein